MHFRVGSDQDETTDAVGLTGGKGHRNRPVERMSHQDEWLFNVQAGEQLGQIPEKLFR